MCPFYNAQLFEITRAAKGVFTHSQSSCHIAKVVLTIRHDSRQIPLAARHHHTFPHRGFLHWRFADAGPGARRATVMGPASANLHKSGTSKAAARDIAYCWFQTFWRVREVCFEPVSSEVSTSRTRETGYTCQPSRAVDLFSGLQGVSPENGSFPRFGWKL